MEDQFKEAFKHYKRATELISRNGCEFLVRFTDGKTGLLDIRKVLPAPVLAVVIHAYPKIVDGVITWPTEGIPSEDENGQLVFHPYDIDPVKAWFYTKF